MPTLSFVFVHHGSHCVPFPTANADSVPALHRRGFPAGAIEAAVSGAGLAERLDRFSRGGGCEGDRVLRQGRTRACPMVAKLSAKRQLRGGRLGTGHYRRANSAIAFPPRATRPLRPLRPLHAQCPRVPLGSNTQAADEMQQTCSAADRRQSPVVHHPRTVTLPDPAYHPWGSRTVTGASDPPSGRVGLTQGNTVCVSGSGHLPHSSAQNTQALTGPRHRECL